MALLSILHFEMLDNQRRECSDVLARRDDIRLNEKQSSLNLTQKYKRLRR